MCDTNWAGITTARQRNEQDRLLLELGAQRWKCSARGVSVPAQQTPQEWCRQGFELGQLRRAVVLASVCTAAAARIQRAAAVASMAVIAISASSESFTRRRRSYSTSEVCVPVGSAIRY